MKILFLDIDGVLNIHQYMMYLTRQGLPTQDKYGPLFDPQCVANLAEIINQTGAQIVISSAWRLNGLAYLQELWSARELPGTIIDHTPSLEQQLHYISDERSIEIAQWVLEFKPESYVVLDDMDLSAVLEPYFIKVNPNQGLTADNAQKAIQTLNIKNGIVNHEYYHLWKEWVYTYPTRDSTLKTKTLAQFWYSTDYWDLSGNINKNIINELEYCGVIKPDQLEILVKYHSAFLIDPNQKPRNCYE